MTDAIKKYNLSKLDLFTPNILHLDLPGLPFGAQASMGGMITLISEPAVIARRDYVHSLFGDKANDAKFMRLRPAAHDRITQHLGFAFRPTTGGWVRKRICEQAEKSAKSMQTEQARLVYAGKALEKERAFYINDKSGSSEDTAIELE